MVRQPGNVCVLLALALLTMVPGVLSAETLHVQQDGKSGFPTIQAAIDAAQDGDVIVVDAGIYTGSGNRNIDLRGKALTITGTEPDNPEVVAGTVVDCQGTDKDPYRAFYVVGSPGATLRGLTITNGLADTGGAVYCEESDLTLLNCRIVANATLAGGAGGGISAVASSLTLTGCEIIGNVAGGDGGGVYAIRSVVYVSDCTIADNLAGAGEDSISSPGLGGHGGGIYADSLWIIRSSIVGNMAGKGGDGLQGAAGGDGGGIYCARATIENCTIEGNNAGAGGDSTDGEKGLGGPGGGGGGVFCSDSLQMTSSLVAGNRGGSNGLGGSTSMAAYGTGGGISCSLGVIDHCTIVANAAGQAKLTDPAGGGIAAFGPVGLTNSIVWDNTPDQLLGLDCTNVAYCDIADSDCPPEQGNIAIDPRFVRPGYWMLPDDPDATATAADPGAVWVAGDYRLKADSPCVDAGDPDYVGDPNATDLAGNARLAGKATDMGAYELETLVPVYRFWSARTNKHFYTADEGEKGLLQEQPDVWTFEGSAYMVYAWPTEPGLMPVYRFWSDKLSSHFWTISEAERDYLIDQAKDSWTYEGPVFYAYPEGSQPAASKPVYRFWSAASGSHFYTISESEKDLLVNEQADSWSFEGVVWYAFEAENGETPQLQAGVYEFASEGSAASCELELRAYFDGREVRINNPTIDLSATFGQMEMAVDLAAMTTTMNGLDLISDLTQHTAIIGDSEETGVEFPLTVVLFGVFKTETARGPFGIDPQTLAFPTTSAGQTSVGDETLHLVGSVVFEGEKHDVDLTLVPTVFETSGSATFDDSGYPGRLDMSMDGPFQWRRQGAEDLLFEADLKGHVLQVYITSMQLRTTGTWFGKSPSEEVKGEKSAK